MEGANLFPTIRVNRNSFFFSSKPAERAEDHNKDDNKDDAEEDDKHEKKW